MDIYASGTEVTVIVPLVDRSGNAIEPSAVSYRVLDQTGTELVPLSAVAGYVAGVSEVTITVAAYDNTLALDAIRGVRKIELACTVGLNTVSVSSSYLVESLEPLVVGLNSFQTLDQATLNAFEVFSLDGWQSATSDQKIIALVEARSRIARLKWSNLSSGQDKLNSLLFSPVDLLTLTQAEFLALPADFLKALQMAQLVEANDILSYTDSTAQKRDEGLMLDTIGEVKQMFRSAKPLYLPVCKKALAYLFKYITFSASLGRA